MLATLSLGRKRWFRSEDRVRCGWVRRTSKLPSTH